MSERLQIGISISGKDLEKFTKIKDYLESQNIRPKNSEIIKMALRGYYQYMTFESEFTKKREWVTSAEAMATKLKEEEGTENS